MAQITIIDTGYLKTTTTTGTQATMVNSGSAITLHTAELTYDGGANIDDTSVINAQSTGATEAVLNFGSITNAKLILSGILRRTSTSEMDTMTLLNDLRKTLGIKLLYYSSTTDGYRDITDSIGSTDTYHLGGTIPHIHVRATGFRIVHTADSSILKYTINLVSTA